MTVMPIGPGQLMLEPGQIALYAKQAGWSGDDLTTAVAIALAESGGRVTATHKNTNGSTDYGLWQVNSIHKPTDAEKVEPLANAKKAHQIYVDAGNKFTPWATYNSGSYRKFLAKAKSGTDNPAPNTDISSPVNGVVGAIDNAVGRIGGVFVNLALDTFAIVIAVVFVVLAIVILMRGNVTKLAKKVIR